MKHLNTDKNAQAPTNDLSTLNLNMKKLFALIIVPVTINSYVPSSSNTPNAPKRGTEEIIFFDDFDDNKNNWTVGSNKNASTSMSGGFYYLKSSGHAYGEAQDIKMDTRKNFQIETRIKILSGNSEHKYYYNMLFWGREANNGYYFTFAKDGYISVEVCSGKTQQSCTVKNGSFQKTALDPTDFNVYKIQKKGKSYTFYVNDTACYTMPFTPFFGNLTGFGAGRNVGLVVDYLKVSYIN